MRVKYKDGANRIWFEAAICGDYGAVEFDGKGYATVPAELGQAMCEAHPDAFSAGKSSGKKRAVADADE